MTEQAAQVHELLHQLEPYAAQVVEAQLADFGETASGGPFVKFRLPEPEALEPYRGRDRATRTKQGSRFVLLVIEVNDDETPANEPDEPIRQPKKGPYGSYAHALHACGFFRAPAVWKALGTDEQFLAWLTTQPCAARRRGGCRGDVVPAHVRRVADGAGTAIKPAYSAIPLCDGHHTDSQHQHGESALGGKEWFDRRRVEALEAWAHHRLCEIAGVESLTQVPPERIVNWANRNGLAHYLPTGAVA